MTDVVRELAPHVSYEGVDRAQFRPGNQTLSITDPGAADAIRKIQQDYGKLAQEVITCHNMIQSGSITVPAGVATATVPIIKMSNAAYIVVATVTTFNGWVAFAEFTGGSRTLTSFGLTFSAAAPAGAGGIAFWIVIG